MYIKGSGLDKTKTRDIQFLKLEIKNAAKTIVGFNFGPKTAF